MSECKHCGGDGLLHLFSSVGPEPCPKCKPVQVKPSDTTGWINTDMISKGAIGYFHMGPLSTAFCRATAPGEAHLILKPVCTRSIGHGGYHAAHYPDERQIGVWK